MKVSENDKNKRKRIQEINRYYANRDEILAKRKARRREAKRKRKRYWTLEEFMELYRRRMAERKGEILTHLQSRQKML